MICEFCQNLFFSESALERRKRVHHIRQRDWANSVAGACTICNVLFENIKFALLQSVNTDVSGWLSDFLNPGILSALEGFLPLYDVELRSLSARDQYVLLCRPISKNLESLHIPTPLGDIYGAFQRDDSKDVSGPQDGSVRYLSLPQQTFRVYSSECAFSLPSGSPWLSY